jgi:hypothetical protein
MTRVEWLGLRMYVFTWVVATGLLVMSFSGLPQSRGVDGIRVLGLRKYIMG